MEKTQNSSDCISHEATRNYCFNKIRAKYNLTERQLQVILVASYFEKCGLPDWGVSDIGKSITEIQESNLYGRLYELIDEGYIQKVSRGRFRCTESANRVALSFQYRFTQKANELTETEKGGVPCQV